MATTTKNVFNKEDFLTANQLAKKLGYPQADIESAMKRLMLRRATVKVTSCGNSARPAVTQLKDCYARLHPMAETILIDEIKNKLQNKGK